MTHDEAIDEIRASVDGDYDLDPETVEACFEAIFERRSDDEDGDIGSLYSHCVAALP